MHMTLEIIVQRKGGSTTGIVIVMKGAGKRSCMRWEDVEEQLGMKRGNRR